MAETHRYVLPRASDEPTELVVAHLWALGALGIWERSDDLVAWFAERPDVGVPPGGRWEVEPDRDWQEEWKATVQPVRAGRIVVVPTWLAEEHDPSADDVTLFLDPGRAFGSGHHATTTLCLELLQELDVTGASVLDVGSGTGILALAAARLGATRVVAVDVDAEAIEVTRANAARLGLEVDTRLGSLDAADQPAEVVLANLVTETVVALAPALAAATAPGGTVITSGIASERTAAAASALNAAGLTVEFERHRAGWAALRCRRPLSTRV